LKLKTIAPNLITFFGMICSVLACFVFLPYDTNNEASLPLLFYLVSGALLFVY